MDKFETIMKKVPMYFWGAFGSMCMIGVIFFDAWWHIFTAAICGAMFLAHRAEFKEEEERNGR